MEDQTRGRSTPEEYPPRKVGVRGILVVADLTQRRNRPPPEKYPSRKVVVRGILVGEDLARNRNRPPPEEYSPRKVGVRRSSWKTGHQAGTGLRPRNTP